MCWGFVLGPIFLVEGIDSATVYIGRTQDRWAIDALFSVTIRLATSR
jgi:hypothetical protein